jgi:2-polyprenyl-3-methyl-5-hydroxy-6-metoxy-1,4-benzoquinol methylase
MLGDRRFDVIFCIAVLHHLPTKVMRDQAIQTMKKYLKPGGVLCMENWNMWQIRKGKKTVWGSYLRGIPKLGMRDIITEWKTPRGSGFLYYYAFTPQEVRRLLASQDFRVLDSYFIRDVRRAHWWNGKNIITIAKN